MSTHLESSEKGGSDNLKSTEGFHAQAKQSSGKVQPPGRVFLWLFDFILLPLLIIACAASPFYRDGFLLSWDEGAPLYWGNAILHGQVPLKDYHINFGPLYGYALAFCMKIFGASLETLRTYVYFGSLASLVLIYFIARMVIKHRLILLILCYYVASFSISPFWMSRWGGIRNFAALVPLLFLLYYSRKDTMGILLLGGLTAGIGFLMSMEMGVLAVCLFLIYLCYTRLGVLRKSGIFFLGFLTVTLPFYGYLWAAGSSIKGVIINLVTMPLAVGGYYRNPPRIDMPRADFSPSQWISYFQSASFDFVAVPVIYAVTAVFLLISASMRRRDRNRVDDLILLLVLFYGVFVFVIGIRGFTGPVMAGPQFTFSLAASAVVGLALLDRFLIWLESKGRQGGKSLPWVKWISLLLVLSFLLATKITPGYRQWLQLKMDKTFAYRPRMDTSPKIGNCILPEQQVALITQVSDYIASRTAAGEYIYAYPHEPHFYFFAGRDCATFFSVAIDAGIDTGLQQDEIDRVERNHVQYAICASNSYMVMDNRIIPNENRIPFMYDYFRKNFSVEKNFDGILILARHPVSDGKDMLKTE